MNEILIEVEPVYLRGHPQTEDGWYVKVQLIVFGKPMFPVEMIGPVPEAKLEVVTSGVAEETKQMLMNGMRIL